MLTIEDSLLEETNNETTEMFEQDSFVLENKIAKLEDAIIKSMNEVARIFEMKYRDFLPHLITVADCQDKILSALKLGNGELKNIRSAVTTTGDNIKTKAEEAPNKKLNVICGFINNLNILGEIERCFSALWMGAENGNKERDILADVTVILQLEVLIQNLELEASAGLEAVNERILPLIIAEHTARQSEILIMLDDFYARFVQFRCDENDESAYTEMILFCKDIQTLSSNLTAMHKLGQLQKHLETFTNGLWNVFCQKIIHSSAPTQIVSYRAKDYDGFITISAKRDISETQKPSPSTVFQALEKFFDVLHNALESVKLEDVLFITLLGDCIVPRLISALTKDVLIPFIPYEKNDDLYAKLLILCNNFCQFLMSHNFVSSDRLQFDYFLENYEKIFVDRRCYHFISLARELITEPYIDLTEVGCSIDEDEESVGDITKMMDEKMKLDEGKIIGFLKSPEADKFSTKLFQFQKCTISTSTFKLALLFQDNIVAAMDAKSEFEMCRLFTTARNIIETFISLTPLHHQQALTTVPQIAAVFFNNCHYICNRLVTVQTDMAKRTNLTKEAENEFNFVIFFTQLRIISANILEQHLIQIRRQISTALGNSDIFVGLHDDVMLKKCERSLNSCTMHIGQVANVWKEVMPELILTHSLGVLVSHLLTVVTSIVLAKEDITAKDAIVMADILMRLVQKLKSILNINGVEVIHRVCEQPYYRISEIIFCLNASLMDIDHRWCEGKGPLSEWLKAVEVKKLIRALFQNTDRRAQLLATIN